MDKRNDELGLMIESVIKEGLLNFEQQKEDDFLSDIYLYFDEDTFSFVVYDDMENCLSKTYFEKKSDISSSEFEKKLIISSKKVLQNLEKSGFFNKDYMLKPFSISMVDRDFIVNRELFFIDDDTLQINNDLFEELDKELDDFLRKLMND